MTPRYFDYVRRKNMTDRDYMMSWIEPDTNGGCWLWSGWCFPFGHGFIGRKSLPRYAHRASYTLFCGAIPEGMSVLHKCDVPACCNPQHLFLGSKADNIADMIQKRRAVVRCGESVSQKLTEKDVIAIRLSHSKGRSVSQLARDYDLSWTSLSRLVKGETWKHLLEGQQ